LFYGGEKYIILNTASVLQGKFHIKIYLIIMINAYKITNFTAQTKICLITRHKTQNVE